MTGQPSAKRETEERDILIHNFLFFFFYNTLYFQTVCQEISKMFGKNFLDCMYLH